MLKLEGISKSFSGRTVLKDINLEFHEGQITFVVGKSGCGKSTLLNILGGLESVDTGRLLLDGNVVTHRDVKYRRDDVSFVFQQYNLVAGLNIFENIALSKSQVDREWINENVEKLGLDTKYKSHTLSGGESQRVAFLRALYKSGKVVLADEPTGNLDSTNGELVLQYLHNLKQSGKIVIVVTHDLEAAQKYSDRIVHLVDGVVKSDIITRVNDVKVADKKVAYANDVLGANNIQSSNENTLEITPIVANDTTIISKPQYKGWYPSSLVIAKNNLLRNWFRSLSLLIIITICCAAMAMYFTNVVAFKNSRIDTSAMGDIDVVSTYKSSNTFIDKNSIYSGSNWALDSDDIDNISSRDYINAVVPIFSFKSFPAYDSDVYEDQVYRAYQMLAFSTIENFTESSVSPSDSDKYDGTVVNIKTVDTIDFFKNRIMTKVVKGDFLSSPYEVLLDSHTASNLFGKGDPIGKTIYAHLGLEKSYNLFKNIPSGVPVKVVGVVDSKLPMYFEDEINQIGDTWFSIVHYELLKIIQQKWVPFYLAYDDSMQLASYKQKFYISSDEKTIQNLEYTVRCNDVKNDDIIEGSIPNDDELAIAIDTHFASMLDIAYGKDKWKDKKLTLLNNTTYAYMHNNYAIMNGSSAYSLNGSVEVSIVGVFEQDKYGSPLPETYMPQAVLDRLYDFIPNSLDLYLKKPESVRIGLFDISVHDRNMSGITNYETATSKLRDAQNIIKKFFSNISVIIAVLLVIVLIVLLKLSQISRRYDIAVVRSLGFGMWRVLGMFVLEFAILSLAGYFLSLLASELVLQYFIHQRYIYKAVMFFPSFLDGVKAIGLVFLLSTVLTTIFMFRSSTKRVSLLFVQSK